MTAQEWYEQGNAFRKESKWHEAINCYIQAIALDPDSPAVEAKRMLDDIMAFYCKSLPLSFCWRQSSATVGMCRTGSSVWLPMHLKRN